MKKVQQGFTLIELMIVVAIIGILAAIAIPAYQDYTARAKVGEASALLDGLKTDIHEYFGEYTQFPTMAQLTSFAGGKVISGKYVSTIGTGSATGVYDAMMKASAGAVLAGKEMSLSFFTINGMPSHRCKAGDAGMPTKFLPSACK